MRKGKCPKCGSTEVYRGTNAFWCDNRMPHLVAYQDYSQVDFTAEPYVCTSCGYVEAILTRMASGKSPC
jgi:predicted RNA-binding Zn-ribbon protein involved in translation (DUF1610 family)